jgi:hypothetical protein
LNGRCWTGDWRLRPWLAPGDRENNEQEKSANEREMGVFHLRPATATISDAAALKIRYAAREESRHSQMLSTPAMMSAAQLTSIGI